MIIEYTDDFKIRWKYGDDVWHYTELYKLVKAHDALDNIKREIESDWQLQNMPSSPFSCGLRRALEIIDKYKEV